MKISAQEETKETKGRTIRASSASSHEKTSRPWNGNEGTTREDRLRLEIQRKLDEIERLAHRRKRRKRRAEPKQEINQIRKSGNYETRASELADYERAEKNTESSRQV